MNVIVEDICICTYIILKQIVFFHLNGFVGESNDYCELFLTDH